MYQDWSYMLACSLTLSSLGIRDLRLYSHKVQAGINQRIIFKGNGEPLPIERDNSLLPQGMWVQCGQILRVFLKRGLKSGLLKHKISKTLNNGHESKFKA